MSDFYYIFLLILQHYEFLEIEAPVESIIGFFVFAIFSIKGKFVISDDEILKYLTLFLKKFIVSKSKGVNLQKSIFIFCNNL